MGLSAICFTPMGYKKMNELVGRRASALKIKGYCKCAALKEICENYYEKDLSEWTRNRFNEGSDMLFIGAAGIAVRAIAPYLKSKLIDSAVIVMDDEGKFVIPILSGHVGGANDLAKKIAEQMDAVCVITTSTDIHNKFAVDLFAKKNNLRIVNKEGIAAVSSKVLNGESITIGIKEGIKIDKDSYAGFINKTDGKIKLAVDGTYKRCDVLIGSFGDERDKALLYLEPKSYVLGIGCRRGKSLAEISGFIFKKLTEAKIDIKLAYCLSSIDIKSDEPALKRFADLNNLEFKTFSKEELKAVSGEFAGSEFVKSKTGVENVCERAAAAAAGDGYEIVLRKCSENGMTLSAAKSRTTLFF